MTRTRLYASKTEISIGMILRWLYISEFCVGLNGQSKCAASRVTNLNSFSELILRPVEQTHLSAPDMTTLVLYRPFPPCRQSADGHVVFAGNFTGYIHTYRQYVSISVIVSN